MNEKERKAVNCEIAKLQREEFDLQEKLEHVQTLIRSLELALRQDLLSR